MASLDITLQEEEITYVTSKPTGSDADLKKAMYVRTHLLSQLPGH
jgi:hypothetical protein